MKQGKIWGETIELLMLPTLEVHKLVIKANARCSRHVHRYKFNAFLVLSGNLFIDVWKADYNLKDTTELAVGDFMTVPPNEEHLFRTGSRGCVAVEIYYPPTLSKDIVRKTVGRVGRR